MRNDQQNQGNTSKQAQRGQKDVERKQAVRQQDRDPKGKKGKSSPSRDEDRNTGRTH